MIEQSKYPKITPELESSVKAIIDKELAFRELLEAANYWRFQHYIHPDPREEDCDEACEQLRTAIEQHSVPKFGTQWEDFAGLTNEQARKLTVSRETHILPQLTVEEIQYAEKSANMTDYLQGSADWYEIYALHLNGAIRRIAARDEAKHDR